MLHNQTNMTIQARAPIVEQLNTPFALKTKLGAAHIKSSAPFPLTDLGNAERLVHHNKKIIRYVHTNRQWLVWQGKFWREDNTKKIEQLAKNTVRRIYAEARSENDPQKRNKIEKHAQASEARGRIKSMIEQAKSEHAIAVTTNDLDNNKNLLNVQNGTIDLHDGKLHPHDPRQLITRYLDIPFNSRAKCPLWLQFLERIMADNQALIAYLQRAIGYSLTGDTTEQCLFFLHGDGNNGKSTFIETALVRLLDPYSYKLPIESLLVRKYAGIPNDIAGLKGARAVIASEVPEGRSLNEALLKDLTGGDTITARFLRQEFFEFQPQFKLWLYGNYKPTIIGNDEGIWRRINIVPFLARISETEKDKNLAQKLNAELPGILAWAVQGALEWQQQGLNPPQEILTATSSYRREMDTIGTFIEKSCVLKNDTKVSAKALYEAYKDWCQNAALSQKRLGERLSKKGLERRRGSGGYYWWHGIELLETKNNVN